MQNVKNTLVRLFIVFVGIIGIHFFHNVNAVFRSDPDYIRQVGVYGYNPYTQSMSINVLRSGLPLTQALGLTKNFFYFEDNVYWWWGYRGTPYVYRGNDCQGYVQSYKICTPIISGNNNPSNCSTTINITSGSSANFKAFFDTMTTEDYYYFHKGGADYGTTWTFCFSSVEANSSLCFDWSNCSFGDSLGYSGVNFDTFQNYWGNNNPGSSSQGGGSGGSGGGDNSNIVEDVTENSSYNDTINYYETRYGWREGMCYVGTNDLTSPYGTSGISFDYGTGDTIFGLYYSLYNSYGDNIIQNVGRFVNTWLINYSQWFATSPSNRLYLASYGGPGSNVSYYYTGLSFPFANNPVAIYFMSSMLFDQYSTESTQGEEMSYYCYLKLNQERIEAGSIDFEEIQDKVTPGITERINTYNNEVLKGKVGFLVPDMSGSNWGEVTSGQAWSGNVDPSNLFDSFYDGIFGLVSKGNFSGNGILPLWIIYPLLFLILFRIIKH